MKKTIKIIGAVLIPIYIIVFLLFMFPKNNIISENNLSAKTEIAELWHIDMFEGGSGSRGGFLKQRAVEFEKTQKGSFILIKIMTYEQMLESLAQGYYPDIFSYSCGIACDILPEICAFNGSIEIYENLLFSGVLENKVFAVPWCCGAYIIAGITEYLNNPDCDYKDILFNSYIEKNKNSLYSFTFGNSLFNNPLLAAFACNNSLRISENSYNAEKIYTQYEAYSKFISKNSSVFLLGTQRDYIRITAKTNASDFSYDEIDGFTDLGCYLSISKNTNKTLLCQNYIEYILSENIQQKLTDINMFSVNLNNLYDDELMQAIQQNLYNYKVLNTFTAKEILIENRKLALEALNGNQTSIEKTLQILS